MKRVSWKALAIGLANALESRESMDETWAKGWARAVNRIRHAQKRGAYLHEDKTK